MPQHAPPPERPRPALLASIGIHALAASAFGFVPLLVFPLAPGWEGEVWVVTQPVLSVPREVKTVNLRDPVPSGRAGRGPAAGSLPVARREGQSAGPAAPTMQPTSVVAELPFPPASEAQEGFGFPGGVDDTTGTGTEGGGGDDDPNAPLDIRGGGLPPDIVLPVPLDTPSPRYPDPARIARMEGVVVLSATIDAGGRVVDVQIEKGVGPFLDRAAIEAVSRWRYVPARIGSRPVAVILRVTLTFRLL